MAPALSKGGKGEEGEGKVSKVSFTIKHCACVPYLLFLSMSLHVKEKEGK